MSKIKYDLPCNLAQTLNLIGEKWTMLILFNILEGLRTYRELESKLVNIPTNLLANRLKELITNGFITQELYHEKPLRYHYVPTDKTKELENLFYALIIWGEKHLDDNCCYFKILSKKGNKVSFSLIDDTTKELITIDELNLTQNK